MNPFEKDLEVETFTFPSFRISRLTDSMYVVSNRIIDNDFTIPYAGDVTLHFYNCTFINIYESVKLFSRVEKYVFTKCVFKNVNSFLEC